MIRIVSPLSPALLEQSEEPAELTKWPEIWYLRNHVRVVGDVLGVPSANRGDAMSLLVLTFCFAISNFSSSPPDSSTI